MSTSDGPNAAVPGSASAPTNAAVPVSGADPASAASMMAREIERVANEMFNSRPAATNVGAGGASPPVMLSPVPGQIQTPTIASAPPPKESDLRPMLTLANAHMGVPLAIPESEDSPYFLGIAGMPGAAPSLASPSQPSFAPQIPTSTTTSIDAPFAMPPSAIPSSVPGSPEVSSSLLGSPSPASFEEHVSQVPTEEPAVTSFPFEFNPEIVSESDAKDSATRTSPGAFDPNAVKRDFPILNERVNGRSLVWLDNAATTQKPNAVIERLSYFYRHENSNVHRAAHELAARATDAYEGARATVRRFLNAPQTKDIVFVRGATEAINLVAKSWGARHVKEGDEILITWLEHHANIVPWQQLAAEKGAKLRVAPVDDRGDVILDEYEKLLSPKTRIAAFTQVSNALGTVTRTHEMVEMAHRHGARVLVDGAQAVSHMPVDVQSLDCDFYVFSGHKIFAPTGIGVLYGKSDILDRMPPWQGGGNMIADVTFEKTVYQAPPWRFEAGTGSIADATGLGAALDYVTSIGLVNINRYEHELREYAEERLMTVPGLRIIGNAPDKAGVISFVLDGQRTEEVGELLNREGIAVRSGHHCAQPILRRFGLESTVRASLAPYNTRDDIDALVAAVRRLQLGRPQRGL